MKSALVAGAQFAGILTGPVVTGVGYGFVRYHLWSPDPLLAAEPVLLYGVMGAILSLPVLAFIVVVLLELSADFLDGRPHYSAKTAKVVRAEEEVRQEEALPDQEVLQGTVVDFPSQPALSRAA